VVSGPFWWEGPAFEKKHAYYEPKTFSINGYSDNFFAYIHNFNADKKERHPHPRLPRQGSSVVSESHHAR